MSPKRFADELSQTVVGYCEAINVPVLDEAAIALHHRAGVLNIARSHTRPMLVASVAVVLALLVGLCNIPAVVAGAQRIFAAFTVAAGQTTPMTVRLVDLERARADMPFSVIAPPPIAGTTIVAVDEIYANAAASDASIIFEIRGVAAEPEVLIIESSAARHDGPTLFALRGSAGATVLPPLHSLESSAPSGRDKPKLMLRGSVTGSTFAPASWVAHGTRVVVMSPPGFLSIAQLGAIRSAMSR